MPSPLVMRRLGGAAFGPRSLPGLFAWYKTDAGVWQDSARTTPAVADSDPVGAWDDQSGNGHHLLQPTSGKRPSLKLSQRNGLPLIQTDGVSTCLTVGSIPYAQPAYVAAIFLPVTWVLSAVLLAGANANSFFLQHVTSSPTLRTIFGSFDCRASQLTGVLQMAQINVNGASSTLQINNLARGGASGAMSGGMTGVAVGCTLAQSAFAQVSFGEILIYTTVPTSDQQSKLATYLNNARWSCY